MDSNDTEARGAGGAAIGRELGARRKFWALLLTHTLLTGACIASCIYTLQKLGDPPTHTYGIFLNMKKTNITSTGKLSFTLTWNNSVELNHGSEVKVSRPGPYIFYICATLTGHKDGKGILTMAQRKKNFSIELQAEEPDDNHPKGCVRQERLVSLYENDSITFSFNNGIKLRALRIGLHYMLGEVYFKTPALGE